MAILDIKIAPHVALRSPTASVSEFGVTLHGFLDDMFDTMLANNGIGLAAPQVGVLDRVAIIDLSGDYMPQPDIRSAVGTAPAEHIFNGRLELINPEIVQSESRVTSEEGCLSIPEYRDSIHRFNQVVVKAHDRNGREFTASAHELLAFAIQHEVDHLNGVLFVDHLSRLKKSLFRKWALKNLGVVDI